MEGKVYHVISDIFCVINIDLYGGVDSSEILGCGSTLWSGS